MVKRFRIVLLDGFGWRRLRRDGNILALLWCSSSSSGSGSRLFSGGCEIDGLSLSRGLSGLNGSRLYSSSCWLSSGGLSSGGLSSRGLSSGGLSSRGLLYSSRGLLYSRGLSSSSRRRVRWWLSFVGGSSSGTSGTVHIFFQITDKDVLCHMFVGLVDGLYFSVVNGLAFRTLGGRWLIVLVGEIVLYNDEWSILILIGRVAVAVVVGGGCHVAAV
ncbi:hypothetical protein [Cyprinid herpesvirus 2]|nr:hypothetical protein [Cyprinid herpesvirus 2]